MNKPIVIGQATEFSAQRNAPARIIKLAKPDGGQAHTVTLGYDQNFKLDLSDIANEKITLVHVGEKLIILFDNQSTLTINPFYDSANAILGNISFDVGNARVIDGTQFAGIFPITEDQSVLPAAGEGGPQSGANFRDASVDPLSTPDPLDLLPQESLGNFVINDIIGRNDDAIEPLRFLGLRLIVEEDQLGHGQVGLFPALSDGNEGPTSFNHETGAEDDFDNDPSTIDGDDDTWDDLDNTTQQFTAQLLVTGGSGNHSYSLLSLADYNSALSSQGEIIRIHIDSATGVLTGYVDNGAAGLGVDDRVVFTLVLTPGGQVTFTIYDQLDHPTLDGLPGDNEENNLLINLSGLIIVSDAPTQQTMALDGVTLTIIDDVPVLNPFKKNVHVIDEDDIKTLHDGLPGGSQGTSPNDGNWDGSYTGNPNNNFGGPATIFGSLAGLVKIGADEWPTQEQGEPSEGGEEGPSVQSLPAGPFNFKEGEDTDLSYLQDLGLSSKGGPLSYDIQDNVLYGFVNVGQPGVVYNEGFDRLVFKLTLDTDGDYTFELYDQLDHDAPLYGANQNFDLQDDVPGDVYFIDFGNLISVTDFDGDSVGLDGKLIIKVRDDVPELIPCDPIELRVDEDDIRTNLSLGTSPNDGNADGSYTGNPNVNQPGPANVSGSLQGPGGVVVSGADEPLTFSFTNNANSYFSQLGLTSKGEDLSYYIQGGVLYGYVNKQFEGPFGPQDRIVFKFTLENDGDFKFELFDQLDHDAGNGQNYDLEVEGPDFKWLEFGDVIKATDYDGDSVVLKDMLKIKVRDDVPEVVPCDPIVFTVDEDDISTLGGGVNPGSLGTSPNDSNADGSYTGNPANNNPGPAFVSGSLASVVQSGADEKLTFSFISENSLRSYLENLGLMSKGGELSYDLQGNTLYAFDNAGSQQGTSYDAGQDRLVFTLQINPATGEFAFKLYDQLDHDAPPSGADQNFDLQDDVPGDLYSIDFGSILKATDYDGDSVVLANLLKIQIRDDVPEVAACDPIVFTVDEDDISTLGGGVNPGSLGTSPNDSNADGSYTGNPANSNPGPAFVSGSLASVVQSGADENLTFSFVSENSLRSYLENLGLTSKGGELSYDVQGNILYAFDNAGSQQGTSYDVGQDRLIFTFEITNPQTGEFEFKLYDQLDHDAGNGQNFPLEVPGNDITFIDFGSVLKATDYDGDTVELDGMVKIKVHDDVPELSANLNQAFKLVHDESAGVQGEDDDVGSMSAVFAGFSNGQNNNDPHVGADPIGYASSDVSVFTNVVANYGADEGGSLTYSLQLKNGASSIATGLTVNDVDGDPRSVTLFKQGNYIVGRFDYTENADGSNDNNSLADDTDPVAFVIGIDASGKVHIIQYLSVNHPTAEPDEIAWLVNDAVQAVLTIEDYDHDKQSVTVNIGDKIGFSDDGPTANISPKHYAEIRLDETVNGGDDNNDGNPFDGDPIGSRTVSGSLLFVDNSTYGADGAKDSNNNGNPDSDAKVFSLHLNGGNGTPSGLQDARNDFPVLLSLVGGAIEGRANGALVFTISIDPSDGDTTVTQYRAVEHDNPNDPDENSSPEIMDSGVVEIKVTVRDDDGDTSTDTSELGALIKFEDDGPVVKVEANRYKEADDIKVALDETTPFGFPDDNTPATEWVASTTVNPANAIGRVSTPTSNNGISVADLFNVSYNAGSDGLQSITHDFGLTLKDHNGNVVPNGSGQGIETTMRVTDVNGGPLDMSAAARTIWLFKQADGSILGVIGQNSGVPGDEYVALRMYLTGGSDPQLVVEQYLPIEHPTGGAFSPDEAVALFLADQDAGVEIAYTVTVTDKDGDATSSTHSIEIIDKDDTVVCIEDDGPSITVTPNGQTGLNTVKLNLDETINPTNDNIKDGDDRYFGAEPTDSNGDLDDVSNGGGSFNKLPVLATTLTLNPSNAIGRLETGAGAIGGLFAVTPDAGTDHGTVSHAFTFVLSGTGPQATNLKVTALDGGALEAMLDGERTVSLHSVSSTVIEGRIPGTGAAGDEYVAFRITLVNAGDPATAKIVVEQFLPIDHGPDATSIFDEVADLLLTGGASLGIKDTVTITDGDNDTATNSATVTLIDGNSTFLSFDDDGPAPVALAASNTGFNGLFFDNFVTNNNAWGNGSGVATGTSGGWTLSPSSVEGAGTPRLEKVADGYRGADSPTNSVMVDMEASPGNMQISQSVTLTLGETHQLTFEAGMVTDAGLANTAILEVWFDGVLLDTIHPTPGLLQSYSYDVVGTGNPQTLVFKEVGDGGDNTGTYLANVKIADIIVVDETEGYQADSDEVADLSAIFTNLLVVNQGIDPDMPVQYAQGSAAIVATSTADYGTDGPAATDAKVITLSASANGVASGLKTTAGQPIYLFTEGAFVVGRFETDGVPGITTADTAAFAVTVDPVTGLLSLAQFVSLEHPLFPATHDEPVFLANGTVLATVTLTDGDGDTVSSSVDVSSLVRFDDDGPVVTGVTKNEGHGNDLIVNGSFEQGHNLPAGQWNIYAQLLPGWTMGPNNVPFELQSNGVGGAGTPDGSIVVELDGDTSGNPNFAPQGVPQAVTNATIQQQVIGTIAGQTYELTFNYAPRPGHEGSSGMQVTFGGVVVWTSPVNPASGWTTVTLTVTAPVNDAMLAFTGTGNGDEFGALLDQVGLRADYNKVLDDEDLTGGIQGVAQNGDDGQGLVASGKVNFDAGSDGLKSISIAGFTGLKAIHVDPVTGVGDQRDVTMVWDENTKTLTGTATDIGTVFTLSIDNSGNYIFTLKAPIAHEPPTDPSAYENNKQLDFIVTVTDGDNDTATDVICINVDDDIPTAVDEVVASVGEGATLAGALDFETGADGASVTKIGAEVLAFGQDGYSQWVDIGQGSIRVKANGEYEFKADGPIANPALVTTTFTVTDGDGDYLVKNASFMVTDVHKPTGANVEATVDDDGLTGGNGASTALDIDANAGDDPADTNEKSFTGNLGGSFGLDGPGFYSLAGMHGQGFALGQENGTYAWNGTDTLLATGPRGPLFEIVINPTTGAYTVTLLDNVLHAQGPNEENLPDPFVTVNYTITDSDNSSAFGSLKVNFDDDAPTATDEASQDVPEGTSVNGALIFAPGADGASVSKINAEILIFDANDGNYSQWVDIGAGSIKVKATGEYVFKADNPTNNPVAVNATFTVTDDDGDIVQADIAFNVTDANTPQGDEAYAIVDDDGLTGGNANSTAYDLDANSGDLDGPASSEATYLGNLGGSVGDDVPGVYSFSEMDGQPWTLGQESGTYSWDSLTSTLTANIVGGPRNNTPLFKVQITDTEMGDYKVTLLDNVIHAQGPNEENETTDGQVVLAYRITDSDNSTNDDGTLTINFDDDAPTLAIVDTPTTVNEGNTFTSGSWDLDAGADGVTSVKVTVNGVEQTLSMADVNNAVTFNPVAGMPGTLVVKADGTWTFQANTVTSDTPVSLTIAAVDGDGDTAADTQSFTVKNVNQPLAFTASVTGLVEEEHGLPGGLDDITAHTVPPNDDSDTVPVLDEVKNVVAGTITLTGVTGAEGALTYSFDVAAAATAASNNSLTSHGAPVLFHVSGNTLTGYVNGAAAGYDAADDREIFTLELNVPADGQYRFTLLDNLDHHAIEDADDVEDIIGVNFNNVVKVTDTGDTNDDKLVTGFTVNVIDDIPSAENDTKSVDEGTKSTVDVAFIVDVSTSMNDSIASVPTFSDNRIGLARYAMQQLLNNNTQIENVMFTRFSSGATSTVWMTRAAALAFITADGNWNLSNSTDYDDALQSFIDNYGASTRPEGNADKTVTYFLSDGAPNASPNGNPGITSVGTGGDVSVNEWEQFVTTLASPPIDQVFAVGLGGGVNAAALNPISYPNTDTDANSVENNVVLVPDSNGVTTLVNTMQDFLGTASSITGNVLSNDGFGADGGYIQSITIDGVTYTYNGNNIVTESGVAPVGYEDNGNWIVVPTTLGGELTFYFAAVPGHAAGEWAYLAPNNIPATTDEIFTYVLVDGDGDNDDATLTITVNNINKVPTAGEVTGAVDDEGLAHGIIGNGTPVTGDSAGNATSAGGTLPGAGGDGALTWSFAGMVGPGTVGQDNVNYTYAAGVLTATIVGGDRAGLTLFTVTLTESTGAYTFNLVNPIKHLAGNSENGDIDLVLNYTVSDTDSVADDANGTLTITLDDDAPANFTAQSMTIANSGSATGSGALNFYESIGADGGSVVFTGTAANDGTNLIRSGSSTVVTSGGKTVKLFGFGTGELTGRVDLDDNGSFETDVFKVTLNPSTSTEAADLYNIEFFRSLDDGAGFTITPTNFTNTSSAAFKVAQGISDDDILVSAVSSPNSRVNGSNGGGVTSLGAGGGVEVGAGELLRFDFATGVTLDGESGNNDFNAVSGSLNHYNANGFAMTVDNSGGSSSIKVIAYDADNDKTLSGDLGDVKDTISAIYKNGILVPLGTLTASDGGYIVPATDGDIITVFTSSGFNRVEAIHAGGEAFALYNVGYLVANTGDPVPLTFSVTATDGDGDQSTGTISVTAAPVNDPPVLSLFGGTVTSGNVSDSFASGNYTGGTGWTGGWTETGDNNASGTGEIRLDGGVLELGQNGNGASIIREANLAGKDTATLTFTYGESQTESGEELIVYFAADGTNYVEVGRYNEDDADGTKTIPLTGPFDSDAKVMFTVTATDASNDLFTVDNVNIAWTDETAAPAEDYSTAYTENAAGVAVASSPSITDVDDTNMVSAQIVLTNAKVGDTFTFAGLPAGITGVLVAGAGTLTVNLTGNASIASYQAAIATVLFSSTAEDASDRIINVTVNDGDGNSNTATTTIDYTAADDAPIAVDDNVIANVAAGSGSQIQIQEWMLMLNDTDVDSGTRDIQSINSVNDLDTSGDTQTELESGFVRVVNNSDSDWGNFDYVLNGGSEADVSVGQDTIGAINAPGDSGYVLIDLANSGGVGGAGATSLTGAGGNDVLIGLGGNDTLTGNLGADIFGFGASEYSGAGGNGTDTITDYDFTAEGDKLDLTALLNTLYSGSQTSANVRLDDSIGGGSVNVQVDVNTGAGTDWRNVATLTGFDTAGAANNEVNIVLNNMMNQTHTYAT